ncbi:MAG: hypothetical protein Q8P68_04915 [Candidatus Peregrinibacteria bacterium]|nr:hypothetical protein [Candidatus Peregrinibacteria bacterium]MDZ4245391.1 hypothetical protein [Candidatus Gracilibacteria bacterium]
MELKNYKKFAKKFFEKNKGKLESFQYREFRWKRNDFAYTKKGVKSSSASGEERIRTDWLHTAIILAEEIEKTTEFKKTVAKLEKKHPPIKQISILLRNYTSKVFKTYLEGGGASELSKVSKALSRDLTLPTTKIKACIKLDGLTLESEFINLEKGVLIRQVRRGDLEEFSSLIMSNTYSTSQHPDIILEITKEFNQVFDMQKIVEKYVTFLSLYKASGIMQISYSLHSESLKNFAGGTLRTGNQQRYLLTAPHYIEKKG